MIRSFFPNLLTSLNLFFGIVGIILTLEEQLTLAIVCILLSGIMDFFDGFVARLMKVSGDFGKQLDSLADCVSFGALPGIIAYKLITLNLSYDYNFQDVFKLDVNAFLALSAFLIPVFSALRLAKFNLDTRQSDTFIGLPTPANAIFWCGIILIYDYDLPNYVNSFSLAITAVIVSLLLISELPLLALKFKNYSIKENMVKYIFLAGCIVIILISLAMRKWYFSFSIVIIWYVIISLVNKMMLKKV